MGLSDTHHGEYKDRIRRRDSQESTAFDFRPGDKVICVDARGLTPWKYSPLPAQGRLYCVREVYWDAGLKTQGICVCGIRGRFTPAGLEWGFVARRFRLRHRG